MIGSVITCTLGVLAMCYLLRALHRSGQVGPDGQELPDEVIWGFREYQGPCAGVQAEVPAPAALELGVTAASVSWRTIELTDDLTLLAAELRTQGERQTRMIRTQAAQITQLTQALQAARSERDHFQRLYEEQRGSRAVATEDPGEVTEQTH
jgi:hypothetical protein